jgi:hypothetical protein
VTAAIPQHTQTIRDGGLGLTSAATDGFSIKVGTSTLGTNGTFYSYQGTDVQQVFDDLGEGPLPHAVAKHLLRSGGKPTLAYKSAAANAGASSAITRSGGSVGPLPTLSAGTANDQYDSQIVIVQGGAVGTATFIYTLDGGDTWSDEIATAATYTLPSSVEITFTAGTYVAGEAYAWTDTAPSMSSTNVGDAMDAIIVSAYTPNFVHILGQAADAAGMVTIATLLATKVSSAWAAKKYLFAVMEAPAVDKALLIAATASSIFNGVVISGGFEELVDDKDSRVQKRSSGRVLAPRIARNPIGVHPLQNETESAISPLEDVFKLVPDGAAASTGYHDEDKTPGLNAARYSTLRTIAGIGGFYPTNTHTFAAPSSDFSLLPYLQIILKAAQGWYTYGLQKLGKRIPKKSGTNFIDTKFAAAMEDEGRDFLRTLMGAAVTEVQVLINRSDNVTADPTLRAKIRLVCPSYIITFESELGLADALLSAA